MEGYKRVTKGEWCAAGGFANSRCSRRMRNGSWQYFMRVN